MNKKLLAPTLAIVMAISFTACKSTDVVGKASAKSFEALTAKLSSKITSDASNYWVLESPTKDLFKWSKDFSSNKPDAVVEYDAVPFIKAGLQVEKLPSAQYIYDKNTGRITMPYEYGQDKFADADQATPVATYKKIVETHRDLIGYHQKLDHYGIALGNGNMFEWAKDMAKNDKDMVFVLNPQPLIDAGVDPAKVEGWAFAKVEIVEKDGTKKQVDKFLRPFELGN